MKEETKSVWITWVNTDLTEGRGSNYPYAVSASKTTAIRFGRKKDVQGSDARVSEFQAVYRDGHWCAPVFIQQATSEDLKTDEAMKRKEAAIEKVKSLGVSPKELEALLADIKIP